MISTIFSDKVIFYFFKMLNSSYHRLRRLLIKQNTRWLCNSKRPYRFERSPFSVSDYRSSTSLGFHWSNTEIFFRCKNKCTSFFFSIYFCITSLG